MVGRAEAMYRRKELTISELIGVKALLSTIDKDDATDLMSALKKITSGDHTPGRPTPKQALTWFRKLIADSVSDHRAQQKCLEIVGKDQGVCEFTMEYWKAATDHPTMRLSTWMENNT
jgi:hypothetical protein